MADRNRRQWNQRQQGEQPGWEPRQSEQYEDQAGQFGESRSRYRSQQDEPGHSADWGTQDRYGYRSATGASWNERERGYRAGRDWDNETGYAGNAWGSSAPGYSSEGTSHSYFRGDDFGGSEQTRRGASYSGGGAMGASNYARRGYSGWQGPEEQRDRGFMARAGDEVASWFGDDQAAMRREQDHRGRGPGNYTRSDQRILEDACDRLTEDRRIDASGITVSVDQGELTLEGNVSSRSQKRQAEDCVEDVSGVKHVQNNLRVQDADTGEGQRAKGTFI